MKKFSSVVAILLMSTFVYTGLAHAGVGVRITGPVSYISYGNWNDFADFLNDVAIPELGFSQKIDNINWVPEFGGEILVSPVPLLDVGLGAGMMLKTAEISISQGGETMSFGHKLRVYPFTLTGYLKPSLPLGFAKPFFYGGVGLYYTKLIFEDDYEGIMGDYSYEAELTKTGFGLHGGAGLEFSVFPKVSIDIGVKARWAKLKGFEGTASDSEGEEMDVFLIFDEDDEGNPVYGPESVEYQDEIEEGEVDLSGFGFVFGIKVMF